MPKTKAPDGLGLASLRVFTNIVIDLIQRLEENPVIESVQEAQEYFKALPSMIIHQILSGSVEAFVLRCQEIVKTTSLVPIIQNGLFENEKCLLPRLGSVYTLMVSANVTHLDFTGLIKLGTLSSGAFNYFHQVLSECLHRVPKLQHLNLKSPNSRTSLPNVNGDHLKILGTSCPLLKFLDISFNNGLKSEDLAQLVPDPEGTTGCPELEVLYIFDCGFSDKIAKVLAENLPNLQAFGFNEMGSVLKRIYKEKENRLTLKLTHINHLGCKKRKTSVSSLRCKKSITEAIKALCPKISNLKARVQDADVEHLVNLQHLDSVELLYNVGRPTSPALGSMVFFQAQGVKLTSVALICSAISMVHVNMLGANCPNLNSLWLRSNHFQVSKGSREELPEDLMPNHNFFTRLKTLYFRVGEGELALTFVPTYVLPYILRNAGDSLTTLKIALRSYIINDNYVCGLLVDCHLYRLQTLLIVVPGQNNFPGVISLTMHTVSFVLDFCPQLQSLGNVLSWDVIKSEEFKQLQNEQKINNSDLNIICRHMVMH